ncbi:MAG: methylenetetrahydrofolate reductase C-terminal domain-containing protein [Actinobacteria bacterium]|nr:methylenetetrahydrofolate reductase C-terminal domain-containing protein [Actinomycetota bacterium]
MIITKQKPFEVVLEELTGAKSVFLVGCGDCATLCETGGEDQVKEIAEKLESEGKKGAGSVVLEVGCHELDAKKEFRGHKDELAEADAILVMSCGAGIQAVRAVSDKPVFPSNDTLFLGNILRYGHYEEKCRLCGDCILDATGAICPVTRCHKGILNGPCGGTDNGKCEVDPDKDCGWTLIYQQLEKEGRVGEMKEYRPPKNWNTVLKPGRFVIPSRQKGGDEGE